MDEGGDLQGIQEVADMLGITPRTLRFYEDKGLIEPSRIGTTRYWNALRSYVAAHRYRLATTKALLDTIDAATSLNLIPTYRPRFPRLY